MNNAEQPPKAKEAVTPLAAQEKQEPPSPQHPPRWPPAVALLNLTGPGLGYLYLKLRSRWLVHLIISVALLVLALWTSGSTLTPALWRSILGLWLLWMALDGWRQARKQTPLGVSERAWCPLVLAALLLGVEAAALGGYLALGQREFDAGMSAYREADCRAAMQHFDRLTASYNQLTLGSRVVTADDKTIECSLLVLAGNARQEGQYADAIAAYRTYLSRYPAGSLRSFVQDTAAATYLEWAEDLQKAQDYAMAVEKCLILLTDYAETTAGKLAPALAAETYAEWATQLRAQGEYGPAIEKFLTILNEYADTPTAPSATTLAAEVYGEWAAHLHELGQYGEAIARYQTLLNEYPDTPTGRAAIAPMAQVYADWADQLRQAGDYATAIARYQTLLDQYPSTPAGTQAPQAVAATYAEWAAHLRKAGQYEQAVARYRVILSQYPDTAAATGAPETAAEIYAEWAVQLRQAGEYEQATTNYQTILNEYPHTPASAEAREAAAETYAEWAVQLRQADDYEAAIDKYHTLQDEYPDTAVAITAQEASAETYAEWATYLKNEGLFVAAVEKLQTLLSRFPDTEAASSAPVALGQTYNEWGQQLYSVRKYTQAMETYTQAKQATKDADVVAAADAGYDQALRGLSQDSSGEGKRLMDQTLETACDGERAPSPAIGMTRDEPGKALFGGSEFSLPDDLRATTPANFHYAVCLENGTSEVQRCPYTGGHTLVRQRQWWRVRVRDTRNARVVADRTFYGSQPESCPFWRSFTSDMDYTTGGLPTTDEILTWLQNVVR